MKVLVIEKFHQKATLFQPVYCHYPVNGCGCTSQVKMRIFEKGEIIELKTDLHPIDEQINCCSSVYRGLLVFNSPVPMHKVIIITASNREIVSRYYDLYAKLQKLENRLKSSEYQEGDTDGTSHDTESIDEVVNLFRYYTRYSAEAARQRMVKES